MTETYVVEWFGVLYGPFLSHQAAAIFAAGNAPVQTDNHFARGKVRAVLPGGGVSRGQAAMDAANAIGQAQAQRSGNVNQYNEPFDPGSKFNGP